MPLGMLLGFLRLAIVDPLGRGDPEPRYLGSALEARTSGSMPTFPIKMTLFTIIVSIGSLKFSPEVPSPKDTNGLSTSLGSSGIVSDSRRLQPGSRHRAPS